MMDLSAYCRPVGASSSIPRSGGGGGVNESYNSNKKRDASYNGNNSGGGGGGGGGSGHQDTNDENNPSNNNKAELKRRCIDYHTPAVLDLTSRLYRKPNRRMHSIPGGSGSAGYPFLQCHT
eukprot:CAMPEP_0201657880 /NCGR_PEP_ID=MMETSP0494-20130426/970_1 /ASSEMBLY_ACC=CAM_ASM_000839 /TAXON_ID=420259 /ORGANISM="Thalassiosira gravida, Strain GMp14c1" /LENGTH=120 /DNA_ID=CAMNT_0048134797 /DNA_START=41 /DNA_END=399 /DNA_ORIENTATION=-